MMQNTKWHPFLIDAGSVYTTCALFSFLFFFMIFGDRSPSEYLYSVVPRNVLFAQRRVARLNLTRHAAATAICSRGSRGGGGFGGGGCGTAAEGRGLGSGSHCELALERGACSECIRGARGEERPAES